MNNYFNIFQKINIARSLFSKTAPLYVQFYITARCNMKCEQCNIIYHYADVPELSLDRIRGVADSLAEIGVCVVLLIGGEPFVRKDLPEIIRIFTERNIHVRMQTNGLASRKQLVSCVEAGGHDISVSLDSLDPGQQNNINGKISGSWQRAMNTVSIINEIFPENGSAFFGTVIMPRNLNQIPGVIEFATEIGWGVSLVPVHYTKPDKPRGFRINTDDGFAPFTPEQYSALKKLLSDVSGMRRKGFNLYDSDEYLDNIYLFLTGQPLTWRRFNFNVCDSPNLYFAIAPDGKLMPCCDFKVRKGFPVYAKDFPDRFRSGEIYDEVRKYTCSCDGCMYGSYPEITITARNYRELFKRAFYFNTAKLPELKKFSTDELMDIADRIRGKNYERQTGAGS